MSSNFFMMAKFKYPFYRPQHYLSRINSLEARNFYIFTVQATDRLPSLYINLRIYVTATLLIVIYGYLVSEFALRDRITDFFDKDFLLIFESFFAQSVKN